MKYETALQELDQLLNELREGTVRIDELEEKVQRASTLINWCRDRLRTVAGQLDEIEGATTDEILP